MLPLLLFLLFLSLFIIVWLIVSWQQEIVGEAEEEIVQEFDSRLLQLLYPYLHYFGRFFGGVGGERLDDFRGKLKKQLRAAGLADVLGPEELFALAILAAMMFSLYGLAIAWMIGAMHLTLTVALGLLGFVFPFLYLRDKVKRRHHQIAKELPFVLDLLTLAVEAGLDFQAAMKRILEKQGNTPLAQELRQLLREISMGRSRVEALKELAERVQLDDVNSVVASLVQAEELGSSLGPVLRTLGEQLRQKRFQRAEKLAMEAPVKLLFPLLFFIMPQVFIVIFAPLVVKILNEGLF